MHILRLRNTTKEEMARIYVSAGIESIELYKEFVPLPREERDYLTDEQVLEHMDYDAFADHLMGLSSSGLTLVQPNEDETEFTFCSNDFDENHWEVLVNAVYDSSVSYIHYSKGYDFVAQRIFY